MKVSSGENEEEWGRIEALEESKSTWNLADESKFPEDPECAASSGKNCFD